MGQKHVETDNLNSESCKKCGYDVSKVEWCPNCGTYVQRKIKLGNKKLDNKKLLFIVLIFLLIIGVIDLVKENPDSSNPPVSNEESNNLVKTTKEGYFACYTEKSFGEAVGYQVAKDREAFQQMFDSKECIWLKGGLKVTIEHVGWTGKMAIRPVGTRLKLWTFTEATD